MRLKRFNEDLDDQVEQGPPDRSKVDPYNEEDWSDKLKNNRPGLFDNEQGVCIHCGSEQLDWGSQDIHDNQYMIYEYHCLDCDNDGQEVYSVEFIRNESR